MTAKHKCLVCGSQDLEASLRCKDHLTGKDSFEIYGCKACGLKFTMDPPSEGEIPEYYDTGDYISHSDSKKGLVNTLFHFTRRLMLTRKRKIIARVTGSKTGTLLDIGCGTGYFASFMKDKGWDVSGLEPNEKARDFAINNFDLKVYSGTEDLAALNEHYDCVTLWHVFEHFHDPVKYLSFIRRMLKPGASCIIAMPNCGSFDAKHYRQFWAAWDVPRHLWHFTPDVFNIFCENNGFNITKIIKLPADVFYISILSERYRGANLPFLSGTLKGLWFSLLALFNKKGSSSLIYILSLFS
jgi:SAM-dependent methyltransferase